MERGEIEAFLTLAEELHFGRTAERLGLSAGRVTQIIQRLERRAGVALFDRTSRRVALTQVGRALRDEVGPAHHRIEEAWARAVAAGRGISGKLALGYLGAPTAKVLIRVMEAFHCRYPDCEAALAWEAQIDDHLAPLRNGRAEVLATRFPVREPDLTCGPLLTREPMVLAVASSHRLALRNEVEVEDLAGETVIMPSGQLYEYWLDAVMPVTTPDGRPILRRRVAPTIQTTLALVGAGEGTLPMRLAATRFYLRPDVVYVPMPNLPRDRWGLVWRTADENGRVRAFAETTQAVVAAEGGPEGMAEWLWRTGEEGMVRRSPPTPSSPPKPS
ncbi:LysR family transcriptional regulator [Streptomyces sp. NPDC001177]